MVLYVRGACLARIILYTSLIITITAVNSLRINDIAAFLWFQFSHVFTNIMCWINDDQFLCWVNYCVTKISTFFQFVLKLFGCHFGSTLFLCSFGQYFFGARFETKLFISRLPEPKIKNWNSVCRIRWFPRLPEPQINCTRRNKKGEKLTTEHNYNFKFF